MTRPRNVHDKTYTVWRADNGPEHEVRDAIEIDEAIRHGLEGVGVDEPAFLSDRLIPVEQLVRRGDPQPDLPGLESCDSGGCFL